MIKKGQLIIEKIKFNEIYERHVHKGTDNSGRISLPVDLIGKQVFVVVKENEVDL